MSTTPEEKLEDMVRLIIQRSNLSNNTEQVIKDSADLIRAYCERREQLAFEAARKTQLESRFDVIGRYNRYETFEDYKKLSP